MATVYWRGDTLAVAQVDSFTPASVAISDTYTITINGKAITFTASVGAVAHVTAGLAALLQASKIPEFQEITWSDQTTYIRGTAKVAGVPFTASASSTGTGTLTRAAVTASAGPNDVSVAANWSGGAIPGGGDTVVVTGGPDWLYGLDLSSAGTWTLLIWYQSANTRCGLPERNASGYDEYRETHLKVNVSNVSVGSSAGTALGPGTGRFKINTSTTATTMVVDFLSSPVDGEFGALSWLGVNASNVGIFSHGRSSCGVYAATTIGTIRVSDQANAGTAMAIGSRTTLTTCEQSGGSVYNYANMTNYTQTGGTCSNAATGTIANLKVWDQAIHSLDGPLTVTNASISGSVLAGRNTIAKTFTNTTIYKGGKLLDPLGRITFTNPFTMAGCSISDAVINVGFNRTYAVT